MTLITHEYRKASWNGNNLQFQLLGAHEADWSCAAQGRDKACRYLDGHGAGVAGCVRETATAEVALGWPKSSAQLRRALQALMVMAAAAMRATAAAPARIT